MDLNNNYHTALIHVSNCVTLRPDPVHMVEIFQISYVMWWKLRRRSWVRNSEEVELY
jgi:hypothetical protein